MQYLPHFLSTFMVENLEEALNLPAQLSIKPRQSFYQDHKGMRWSIVTLKKVLSDVLVPLADGTQPAVIECPEWESETCAGITNLMYHRSHRQVAITKQAFHTISYYSILCIPFHTISYHFIL